MHLVEFLRGSQPPDSESVEVEYRLACSGELYNRKVVTADWRKSDITRVLLRAPFELFVASQPFNDYPQELCVRLKLPYKTDPETRGVHFISLRDDEIMEDLCSILSLLARRLISVVGRVRECPAERDTTLGSYGWDLPVPVLNNIAGFAVWRRRGASIITSLEGQQVKFHNVPSTGVDDEALKEVLLKLADLPAAEPIVRACRLYKTALELIEDRPDIAYQLLISATETMAGAVLSRHQPDEADILRMKRQAEISEQALAFELDEAQAKTLALIAAKGNPWSFQKFKKFITDNVSAEEFDSEDAVFPWACLRPSREHFEKALSNIYSERSGNLHGGKPFPRWIGVGTSPFVNPNDLPWNGLGPNDVPPVVWFDRVVSTAVRRYVIGQCGARAEPFSDFGTSGDRDTESRTQTGQSTADDGIGEREGYIRRYVSSLARALRWSFQSDSR